MNRDITKPTKSHMRAGKVPMRSACLSVKSDQSEDGKDP